MGQNKLDKKIIQEIENFVDKKRKELIKQYPNILLRDETLKLLSQHCTVIYYPLKNEANNGFHIDNVPIWGGKCQHFVFINTAQTLEKQVFTAAHELGHVWMIDSHIRTLGYTIDEDISELIINRFAAELLMPKKYFTDKFEEESAGKIQPNGAIRAIDMLRIIVIMMNHFFVPWKSAVMRFCELNILSEKDTTILLGEGHLIGENKLTLEMLENTLDSIKNELGYTHLINPTNKKWIENLPELLDQAEKYQVVSPSKITELRKKFGLEKTIIDQTVQDYTITPTEGR